MARNGSGTYSLVNTASITTGGTISSTDMMATLTDIANALTASIAKDGQTTPSANLPMGSNKLTGLSAGSSAGDSLRYEQLFTTSAVQLLGALNQVKGADIASAGTINLTTATGNGVHVTGTTAITAVTLGSGMVRWVIFDGVLTLTHHATNNNLPGAANITTAAGDRAIYWSDGTTVYCLGYFPAAGNAVSNLLGLGTGVATALAVNVGSAGAPVVNGGALGTPSSGNLGNCTGYPVPAGAQIQDIEATPYTTNSSHTTVIPKDDSIPQNTEGEEVITVTITPTSATNRLRIECNIPFVSGSAAIDAAAALFQDSTANALAVTGTTTGAVSQHGALNLVHEMAAGTTSATTFKVRVGPTGNTLYLNGYASRLYGGVCAVRLRVIEIKV